MNGLPPRKKSIVQEVVSKILELEFFIWFCDPQAWFFFSLFFFPTSMTSHMDSELIVVLEVLWLIKWLELKDDWFMVLKIEQNTSHSC